MTCTHDRRDTFGHCPDCGDWGERLVEPWGITGRSGYMTGSIRGETCDHIVVGTFNDGKSIFVAEHSFNVPDYVVRFDYCPKCGTRLTGK